MTKPLPCPICSKPSVENYKPFCSKRCADLDLGKWLSGTYTVPVVEHDDLELPDEGDEQTEH